MKKTITLILISIALAFASFGNSKDYYINKGTEYILQVNKKIADSTAQEISSILWEQALKHNLDYHFVLGIITTESRFNINAKSYCGAIGLMQIMPRTAQYIAKKYKIEYDENLYDIETNIKIGVAYLSHLKKKFNNYELVAAGYN
ncbi:MAG: transglycosylase SLT domain-containing protein, partial [Clostridia bacterium]|nr:transglycosylase SLT domain-containing protein [Clostridia bacterium]